MFTVSKLYLYKDGCPFYKCYLHTDLHQYVFYLPLIFVLLLTVLSIFKGFLCETFNCHLFFPISEGKQSGVFFHSETRALTVRAKNNFHFFRFKNSHRVNRKTLTTNLIVESVRKMSEEFCCQVSAGFRITPAAIK